MENHLKYGYILRLLQLNQTDIDVVQNPSSDDKNYPDILEDQFQHEEYLWLLIFDLLIFIGLALVSYSSSKKLKERAGHTPGASTAEDFKPKFIKGLIYANGSKQIKFNKSYLFYS